MFYTNKALADRLKVPVKAKDHAASRAIALSAIEEICTLSHRTVEPTAYSNIIDNITLSKLESILELTRFPDEYENLALPMTLIFALNTCLLKYAEVWDETIFLIEFKRANQRLLCFWDRSAQIILQEALYYDLEKKKASSFQSNPPRRWSIPYFDQGKLDKLLSVLHSDRKNLLIALRDTGSLGLSALFFIMRKHIETKRPSMSTAEYMEKVFLPYCRISYRYQVVLPDLGPERFVSRALFPVDTKGLSDKIFIDTDDSRNIPRAYIYSVQSPGYRGNLIFADGMPLNFIMLHEISGCEDLIPDMFEATIRVLWDILLIDCAQVQTLDHYVRCVMYNFCCILSHLKTEIKHSRTIEHSWIYKLADKIIENDVVGLILRSTLLKSTSESDDSEWARLEDSMLLLEINKMCQNPRCPAPFKAGITNARAKRVCTDGTYCSSRCMDMDRMDSFPA
ncbi:unnamed protein product [Rhizoctonia solani]|uniref:Uncharacterized protein n=1 Tax=Rhizoctonia solani TaxID=456999 RepID=A0A8H3B671_9AGAM|nr:unnamed protein product [Rhizoctonia solani]